jgi:hypothetical protein
MSEAKSHTKITRPKAGPDNAGPEEFSDEQLDPVTGGAVLRPGLPPGVKSITDKGLPFFEERARRPAGASDAPLWPMLRTEPYRNRLARRARELAVPFRGASRRKRGGMRCVRAEATFRGRGGATGPSRLRETSGDPTRGRLRPGVVAPSAVGGDRYPRRLPRQQCRVPHPGRTGLRRLVRRGRAISVVAAHWGLRLARRLVPRDAGPAGA